MKLAVKIAKNIPSTISIYIIAILVRCITERIKNKMVFRLLTLLCITIFLICHDCPLCGFFGGSSLLFVFYISLLTSNTLVRSH